MEIETYDEGGGSEVVAGERAEMRVVLLLDLLTSEQPGSNL